MEDISQQLEEEIRDRIRELVDEEAPAHRKFKFMEETVGSSAMAWRNIYNGSQKASMVHLAMLGSIYPEYAAWLLTGKTEDSQVNTSPVLKRIKRDLRKAGRDAA